MKKGHNMPDPHRSADPTKGNGSGAPAKPELELPTLLEEASMFAAAQSTRHDPTLFGINDSETVGTYMEQKFHRTLRGKYSYEVGSSAKGIDFPGLDVDMKVTSVTRPQSSSPFENARQKIYGLGYSLLIFIYQKLDDDETHTSRLDILHTIFIDKSRTADYQTTLMLNNLLQTGINTGNLIAFLKQRGLPIHDVEVVALAEDIRREPPLQGYLTISNALQWRLQYSHVITAAGTIDGVEKIGQEGGSS